MTNTVFIADDDRDIVDLLTVRCRKMGLHVETAADAMTALEKIEAVLPDVAILDVDMPCGNGLCVSEMMAQNEKLADIPVIVVTASTNPETIKRCHQQLAYYVPKCPDVWHRIEPLLMELLQSSGDKEAAVASESPDSTHLIDAVFAILGNEGIVSGTGELSDGAWSGELAAECAEADTCGAPSSGAAGWVLSIEDDEDFANALRLRFEADGVTVVRASGAMEGYRRAFMDAPRAIILDYELPDGNGDYVLRRLKESPATCNIPVIVLTGRHETSIERQMRSLGASEFLRKPFDWQQLRDTVQRVSRCKDAVS